MVDPYIYRIKLSEINIMSMFYQFLQRSYFKQSFDLEARIEKRKNIMKQNESKQSCFVVIQYPGGPLHFGNYELFCVSSKLNLRNLYEFIRRRVNKSPNTFFFTVKGSMRNLGENIGVLSNKYKQEDGFVYIFIQTENTF